MYSMYMYMYNLYLNLLYILFHYGNKNRELLSLC